MLGNGRFHIKEKQDFTMKIAHPVRLAVKVAEVIGVGVEAEVAVGHDHTQDQQDLHQDLDLVLEAHTEVVTEVEEVLICGRKDGPQEAEVDHLVHELTFIMPSHLYLYHQGFA